jgi:hypothetical protein
MKGKRMPITVRPSLRLLIGTAGRSSGIALDEVHVLVPSPVPSRIGVAVDAAPAAGTTWDLAVPDYVIAVDGYVVFEAR